MSKAQKVNATGRSVRKNNKVEAVETVVTTEVLKGKRQPVIISDALAQQVAAFPSDMSKSAKIRLLLSEGHSRAIIAKALGILYQHVRNVEITPLKKGQA